MGRTDSFALLAEDLDIAILSAPRQEVGRNRGCGCAEKIRRRDVCGERGHAPATGSGGAEVRGGGALFSRYFCAFFVRKIPSHDVSCCRNNVSKAGL